MSQVTLRPPTNDRLPLETVSIEVSVVIPCLNEADTLATCITKVQRALREHEIRGEVIVADNGSVDGSREIALKLGAKVVDVKTRGYGAALMGGIAAASGRFIVMGDADDSYDFGEVPRFLQQLRRGFELVQGCRLPVAGGTVMPGAMPFLHRWLGNPLFSAMARWMFGSRVHDVYCGLRGFTKDLYQRLDLRCTGMEFATEMVIKASLHGARIGEVPITLHPDGRRAHGRHLRTFRDGWRTMRFFLIYSPRWLFLLPGALLAAMGLLGYAVAMPGLTVNGIRFDAHTLLFSSLFTVLGYQSCLFALLAWTFAVSAGLLPEDRTIARFYGVMTLERGLLLGFTAFLVGAVLLGGAANEWRAGGFGDLSYPHTMRLVIPGATLAALGAQTALSSWFAGLLRMSRR